MAKEADSVWETRFAELQAFRKRFGHCRVPLDWPHNKLLAKWVVIQQNRHGRLSLDQLKKLSDLGFPFEKYERIWLNRFFEWVIWHQNCNRRNKSDAQRLLMKWEVYQRKLNRLGKLSIERQHRLEQIGFDWNPEQTRWEGRLRELIELKKKHGHCRFAEIRKAPNSLREWVYSVLLKHRSSLSKTQLRQLAEIGFVWPASRNRESRWQRYYQKLAQFKAEHGHTRVPQLWPPDPFLAIWVCQMRGQRSRLSSGRLQRLDDLQFDWDPHATDWAKRVRQLAEFKRQHGHCNVPTHSTQFPTLAGLVTRLRGDKHKGLLKKSQIRELDELGFCWSIATAVHTQRLSELADFKRQHGHCRVPRSWKTHPELASWVQSRRIRRDLLPKWLREALEALQFEWDARGSCWEKHFQELVGFQHRRGHCNVPQQSNNRKSSLSTWVAVQRKLRHRLPSERVGRLNKLGFQWAPLASRWQDRYERLKTFHQQHGHYRVHVGWAADRVLATWVSSQRTYKAKGSLLPERIGLLDEIGFEWNLQPNRGKTKKRRKRPLSEYLKDLEARWQESYAALKKFKAEHGHCLVRARRSPDSALGRWVNHQRARKKKGALSESQIRMLDKLGFSWSLRSDDWSNRLAKLKEFQQQYGHCSVPQRWPDNPQLGHWVYWLRQHPSRVPISLRQALDHLRFEWAPRAALWEKRFRELAEFKQKHGHCSIPCKRDWRMPLAHWVVAQRLKRLHLSEERLRRLNQLGFDWDPFASQWQEHYSQLKTFQQQHGHCRVPQLWFGNPTLGRWVSLQRDKKKKGRLDHERTRLLNEIGFDWSPMKSRS